MPLLANVLDRAGSGQLLLRDVTILGRADVPPLPVALWLAVSALGLLGCWLLTRSLLALALDARDRIFSGRLGVPAAVRLFAALTTALYLLPLLPGGPFDRYLAPIAPVLWLALGPGRSAPATGRASLRAAAACAWAAGLAAFSVAEAHDYLSWNRARWRAIAEVESRGEGDAHTFDGGFEYNGERSFAAGRPAAPGKSWWWVVDDALQLSFAPLPGTETMRRYPYDVALPPGGRAIYLLRRAAAAPAAISSAAPPAAAP